MAHIIEATQQFLLDQCSDALAIIDVRHPDWSLLATNRAFRHLFPARSPVDAPSLHAITTLVPTRDVRGAIRRALGSDEPVIWDNLPLTTPAGQQERTRWQFRPIRDDDGTASQIVLIVTRITTLGEMSDALGAIIDALPEAIILVSRDGRIQRTNAAVASLLGRSSLAHEQTLNDALGALALRHENGEPFDPAQSLLAPALRGEHRPILYLRLGGGANEQRERILAATATPLPSTTAVSYAAIVVLRDVSEQKREEAEKDSFLSLISHEIKSPLTSIKGFSQLALRAIAVEDEPLPRAMKHLRVIEQQANRIGHLISDISDVSRLQRGILRLEPTLFDFGAIVATVVEQQAAAIHSHRLDFASPETPLIVRADPRRVQQIATNLITNAVKYSPHADRIAVRVAQEGPYVRLAVRDWGIGISSDDQARIFDRFYRTGGGNAAGLGLGLYIDHEIAALSGGELAVESYPNQGSTFRLDLPLAQPGPDDE